jgi:hypothetical protein
VTKIAPAVHRFGVDAESVHARGDLGQQIAPKSSAVGPLAVIGLAVLAGLLLARLLRHRLCLPQSSAAVV